MARAKMSDGPPAGKLLMILTDLAGQTGVWAIALGSAAAMPAADKPLITSRLVKYGDKDLELSVFISQIS
jgi:hypothetical protein